MQGLVRTLFAIGGALAFLNSAYAQSGTCANYQATQVQCYGPNNCHGYVAVIRPTSVQECVCSLFMWHAAKRRSSITQPTNHVAATVIASTRLSQSRIILRFWSCR